MAQPIFCTWFSLTFVVGSACLLFLPSSACLTWLSLSYVSGSVCFTWLSLAYVPGSAVFFVSGSACISPCSAYLTRSLSFVPVSVCHLCLEQLIFCTWVRLSYLAQPESDVEIDGHGLVDLLQGDVLKVWPVEDPRIVDQDVQACRINPKSIKIILEGKAKCRLKRSHTRRIKFTCVDRSGHLVASGHWLGFPRKDDFFRFHSMTTTFGLSL